MGAPIDSLAILTYHSISSEPGPTSILPETFDAQMAALADAAVDVVGLDFVEAWMTGERRLARPAIAVTFDDAFRDFADTAFPALDRHGFRACVFAPTEIVGGVENWRGANQPPRALMGWAAIRELSAAGVDFGSHTERHSDLTTLCDKALEADLAKSRKKLEDMIGKSAPYFAPPYGRSNARVRSAIARHYAMSVGVRLGRAHRSSPKFDLPRIEMHYFRDISRWRAFVGGGGRGYFAARQTLRGVRALAESAINRRAVM